MSAGNVEPEYKSSIKKFRDWLREHIVPINNLVLISTSVTAVCDFFTPRSLSFNRGLYTITAAIALILIIAAFFPKYVDKALAALGYEARASGKTPVWQSPVWMFLVVLLLIFSTIGFASVAKASEGGLLASKFTSVKSAQEVLLSLKQDVAEVKAGVDSANIKLDSVNEKLASQQAKIDQDPNTIGFVKLEAQEPSSDTGTLKVSAVVYLNARGSNFSQLQLRGRVEAPGQAADIDLSSQLTVGVAGSAQIVSFAVPMAARRIVMCMTAPHPTLNDLYTAVWSYGITGSPRAPMMSQDQKPRLEAGAAKYCY